MKHYILYAIIDDYYSSDVYIGTYFDLNKVQEIVNYYNQNKTEIKEGINHFQVLENDMIVSYNIGKRMFLSQILYEMEILKNLPKKELKSEKNQQKYETLSNQYTSKANEYDAINKQELESNINAEFDKIFNFIEYPILKDVIKNNKDLQDLLFIEGVTIN